MSKESTPDPNSRLNSTNDKSGPHNRGEAVAREVSSKDTKQLFDDERERRRDEARARAKNMSDQQLGITRTPSKREKGEAVAT